MTIFAVSFIDLYVAVMVSHTQVNANLNSRIAWPRTEDMMLLRLPTEESVTLRYEYGNMHKANSIIQVTFVFHVSDVSLVACTYLQLANLQSSSPNDEPAFSIESVLAEDSNSITFDDCPS